ncbi:hypothetical protein GCM10010245_79870 [Streptomyces spectabilis]|uniref:Uncharacterized protein n=1 Tax=Streptomyces spectabilis TaxID=68270 RepID=A0A7W8EZQ7_STRST|nr:hypothetical protein [Streptomyces spectabilis]MBB5109015.1 hypothetical protein [Streptomyces spectabilis]GGV50671.1 hypothetical protein GCM10010245_79870 [Streptomyces spectabilis]
MPTPPHVLVAPVVEGGEFVFAHAGDSALRVWTRNLTCRVEEQLGSPRRGVGAALYGGRISDMAPLKDFVTDFVDHATDTPPLRLTPARIQGVHPLRQRCNADSPTHSAFFAEHVMSPLHTYGPWDRAAPELLLSRTRGTVHRSIGFFATGLPELPTGLDLAALALPSAAVISREGAEDLAEFLHAPPGPVLEDLLHPQDAERLK